MEKRCLWVLVKNVGTYVGGTIYLVIDDASYDDRISFNLSVMFLVITLINSTRLNW